MAFRGRDRVYLCLSPGESGYFFTARISLPFSFGLGVIRGQVGVEDCVLGKDLTASLWEKTIACRDSIRGDSSRRNGGGAVGSGIYILSSFRLFVFQIPIF